MTKDPDHWLYRLNAREWIQASLAELRRAEEAYSQNNARAGHAGARRAAGMALNGALIYEPDEAWGRSYMDHLAGVRKSMEAPDMVRDAAAQLIEAPTPGGSLIGLRSRSGDERLMEAARTVMAHAYAVVARHEGDITEPAPDTVDTLDTEEIPS